MEETVLISRAKKGDLEAFELLLGAYQAKVYNLCLKLLGNREDASDAAQDALLRVYRKIGSFHEKSLFSTWVYRLTYNVCMDRHRSMKRAAFLPLDETVGDPAAPPEEAAEAGERAAIVQKALASLPYDFKTVLILRDIEGYSYEEISRIVGCSVGTVKSRINRGRGKLKEILSLQMEQFSPWIRQNSKEGGHLI